MDILTELEECERCGKALSFDVDCDADGFYPIFEECECDD